MTIRLTRLLYSLRFNLFVTTIVSLSVVLGFVAWIAYDKGRHEAEELMDGQLALSARLLEGQIHHEDQQHSQSRSATGQRSPAAVTTDSGASENAVIIEILNTGERQPYEQELAFQIWSDQGVLTLVSANAREMRRIPQPGYHLQEIGDSSWRVFVKQSSDGKYWIQVAHPLTTRHMIGLDVAERVTIPVLMAFPFLVLMMLLVIDRSLRPLRRIADKLKTRAVNDLESVPTQDVPVEIVPFIDAINSLLGRVSMTLENERRFTSNAAHELRTPLAGIKLHAQLAVQAQDAAARDRFVAKVLDGVARAERLVEQMLRLARLSPEAGFVAGRQEQIDARTLLMEVEDIERVNASAKGQRFVIDIPENAQHVIGDENLLRIALCNLAGNASRYSPGESTITLGCWRNESGHGLYVEDQGGGITPEELPFITQRFKRGTEVRAEGSGLGLTIVERIAELHCARLQLRNLPQGGLRAEIVWAN